MAHFVFDMGGEPATKTQLASSNTAATISSAYYTHSDGNRLAVGMTITVETNSIRFAYGTNPTQAGLGTLVTAGSIITLNSIAKIKAFRYISAVLDTHATLQFHPEF